VKERELRIEPYKMFLISAWKWYVRPGVIRVIGGKEDEYVFRTQERQ
jgi:hypothetical protein